MQNNNQGDNSKALIISRIKQTGDKIKVTLENCEVKSRTYREENINSDFPTRIEMLDGIYDSNRNYKTRDIQQTYIVCYKKYGDNTYKFVSQAINTSADTLKRYIDKQAVDLYVERTNPKNYYFDLPVALGKTACNKSIANSGAGRWSNGQYIACQLWFRRKERF